MNTSNLLKALRQQYVLTGEFVCSMRITHADMEKFSVQDFDRCFVTYGLESLKRQIFKEDLDPKDFVFMADIAVGHVYTTLNLFAVNKLS